MLSILRRSTQKAQIWRVQQRSLAYTASGEAFVARPVESVSTSWGAGHEFDADSGEFVSKEVSIHDRQRVRKLSEAEAIAEQERDYSSSKPSTACFGRDTTASSVAAAAGGIPKPWAQEYEQPLPADK